MKIIIRLQQDTWVPFTQGQTTCGLLIGISIAISLRCGEGKKNISEEHESERGKAILAVEELYNEFLKKFGSTESKTLNQGVNFSEEEWLQWANKIRYKQTCDVFLKFVFEKCIKMAEEGKIKDTPKFSGKNVGNLSARAPAEKRGLCGRRRHSLINVEATDFTDSGAASCSHGNYAG